MEREERRIKERKENEVDDFIDNQREDVDCDRKMDGARVLDRNIHSEKQQHAIER